MEIKITTIPMIEAKEAQMMCDLFEEKNEIEQKRKALEHLPKILQFINEGIERNAKIGEHTFCIEWLGDSDHYQKLGLRFSEIRDYLGQEIISIYEKLGYKSVNFYTYSENYYKTGNFYLSWKTT